MNGRGRGGPLAVDVLDEGFANPFAEALDDASQELNDHLRSQSCGRPQHARLLSSLVPVLPEPVFHALCTCCMHVILTHRATVHPPGPPPLALPAQQAVARLLIACSTCACRQHLQGVRVERRQVHFRRQHGAARVHLEAAHAASECKSFYWLRANVALGLHDSAFH